MRCANPISGQRSSGAIYHRRCGTCSPCVISRAAMWTLRNLLESTQYNSKSFLTLTYSQENYPENGTVLKSDAQGFLKKLRHVSSITPVKELVRLSVSRIAPRYYLCGEYGEKSGRAHYHALVYGYGPESQKLMQEAWSKGFVQLKPLIPERVAYACRYTQKKSFWPSRPSDGRAPEFSLMSKKPGLGHGALPSVADKIMRASKGRIDTFSGSIRFGGNLESLWKHGVPECLRYDGKIYPMGPYLVDELCRLVGVPRPGSEEYRADSVELAPEALQAADDRLQSQTRADTVLRRQQMRSGL